jgi:photosystem II stability/assembly factor-like uncharacterized protein
MTRSRAGRYLPLCALVAALAVCVCESPAASSPQTGPRLDRWEIIGPGGGGTTRYPLISPHDVNEVLVACDMTGAYLTLDGGQSWRMFNLGTGVSSFAFDPAHRDVIYAGTAAVWQSRDRGRTWRMAFPRASVSHALMLGDHADYALRTNDPRYPRGGRMAVEALAVAPDGTVAAAIAGGSRAQAAGALVVSPDGDDWRTLHELPPGRALALAYGRSGQLALVTDRRVFVQRGHDWIEHEGPPGAGIDAASVVVDDSGTVVVYAVTAIGSAEGRATGGLFASRDGGATWTPIAGPLLASAAPAGSRRQRTRFTAISAFPPEGLVAYVGFEGLMVPEVDGQSGAARANGIARTDDGGRTWRIVHAEGRRPSPKMEGSWVEARASTPGPDIWFDAPYDLSVSPTNRDVVYVTDLFRTYRTLDGGQHWAQVHSRRVGHDAWTSRGLDVTTVYGVHVDPQHPRRIFISNTDIGLFRSEDGGRSWIGSSEGIPQRWRNTTYWIAFDPADSQTIWGAFSGTHDLPRPKMWRNRDPETYRGGVGISQDGGRTWSTAPGLPVGAVTHVLVDPDSAAAARTVYACLFGRGVYKSTDGGQSWTQKNAGIAGAQPFAWRLVPAPPHRLYLIVSRRSENGAIGDAGDGALYVSDNGGDAWTPVRLPEGTNGPTGLLVDPQDPQRLYLSAWGVAGADRDTGGGIFLSANGGRSWTPIFTDAQHVYDVTLDRRTSTLYASGFDQGAWRSTDRGATWHRLQGFDFKWGHRVIPDPATPDRVYITTFGGGVWHGPVAGK